MEEPLPPIDSVEEHSAKTAEMLRTMREQADKTLETHRQKIGEIETELSRRIHQIAEELARDSTDEELAAAAALVQCEELDKVQSSLHESEAEVAILRDQILALTTAHEAEITAKTESLEELTERHQELCEQHAQVTSNRDQLGDEVEQLRAERDSLADEYHGLAGELEQLLTDARENDRHRDEMSDELEELSSLRQSLQDERDLLAEQLEQMRGEYEQACVQCEDLTGKLRELSVHSESLQQERDQLTEKVDLLETSLEEKDQLQKQLSGELEELHGQHTQLSEEREQLENELQAAREKGDLLEADLQALQQEHQETMHALEELRTTESELAIQQQLVADLNEQLAKLQSEHEQLKSEQQEELEQSQRKCELALADAHQLKRENAELHEQLASRPESLDQDSPELVSLRAERDALAGRVEELENASTPVLEGDNQQEFADLQSRFEMAVEDVRDLKQENASLREQLSSSSALSVEAAGGDMGWQAQKARLLASLDDEDQNEATPERLEELATIEGTISITDRVVSEKDREISELKEQLEAGPVEIVEQVDVETVREEALVAAREELFDKDEVIQAERQRLEELQHEWEEKLREAELDISVQRASLAREKAKVEEKIALLEKETAELEQNGAKPKHRWLSALGLKEEESQDD